MKLLEKIQNKSALVGVVGLGYVGLPMAVTVARKGFKVIGIDTSDYAVNHVNDGENYIGDVDDAELKKIVKNGSLKASFDYKLMKNADVIMIAVPTPLDKYQQPNSSFVRSSVKSLAENVSKDTLIILESTTYPGTTREILVREFEKNGFQIGKDIFIAFSPERVDPGNKDYKTSNTPKIVGGITENCNKVSKKFYETILDADVFLVSSPEIAEMEKIYENTFRNINIALANEMTILCEKMEIDIWEVIEAAKTKPYGFMAFYPGPGVGGHCIPLDPFYLTWKAREYNYHTRLIELAGEINMSMPTFVVNKAAKLLNEKGISLSRANILLLGAAYKKDIADFRESPILPLISILEKNNAKFVYNDPHIPEFIHEHTYKKYHSVNLDNIEKYDLVIILTAHSAYDYDDIVKRAKLILDTRFACKKINAENLIRL